MKKILLLVLMLAVSVLSALVLNDFDPGEQDHIIDYLTGKISLTQFETIRSVEGDKYQITDYTDDYVIIIMKDGTPVLIPRK
jgi:hypothetical protein